jgi:hypothetical protein
MMMMMMMMMMTMMMMGKDVINLKEVVLFIVRLVK